MHLVLLASCEEMCGLAVRDTYLEYTPLRFNRLRGFFLVDTTLKDCIVVNVALLLRTLGE
jgi:hypothetical protein